MSLKGIFLFFFEVETWATVMRGLVKPALPSYLGACLLGYVVESV
jgi:hypothetical protein